MKMKNIYIGLVGLFLLGATTSCDDFLEEKPKNNMQSKDYYTNGYQAKASVNKLYRSGVPEFYNAGVYNGAKIMYGSFLSGFYDNEYKGQEVIAQYSQELSISSQNISLDMDGIWDPCYEAIGRANTALKYIPGIDKLKITDNERSETIAQAKFFRAMNYFHLVKVYGDVPLIIDPYEEAVNMNDARTPSADVYAKIIEDLNDALAATITIEENKQTVVVSALRDRNYASNQYKITKAAAETLLANVYLQMSGYPLQSNHYADAATAAKKVISAGRHVLTANTNLTNESAYNRIRTDETLSEIIYSKEFDATISKSYWTQLAFPVVAGSWGVFKYTLTNNASQPVDELLNVYDPAQDLRIADRQFFFNEYTYTKEGVTKTVVFDRPAQWFYFDEKGLTETGNSDRDFPIFRYAEVLLVAAEAIAQSEGVTEEAAGYLAQVRARAYTNTTEAALKTSLKALSKEAFIEEVWTERTREFMLEHKIWDDIQRTRKYPTTDKANKGKVKYINLVGAKNPWGATFQEKHLLWPISFNELQRNPSLVQNTGY